jgi:hypothetical protein
MATGSTLLVVQSMMAFVQYDCMIVNSSNIALGIVLNYFLSVEECRRLKAYGGKSVAG